MGTISGQLHSDELNCVPIVDEIPNYQTRDNRVRPRSNPGSKFMNTYNYVVEKSGAKKGYKHLEISGQTNVYEKIQADADSCDINKIIARFVAGDTEALNKVRGMYIDTTDFPTNYAEFLQRQLDANHLFDRLPIDVKEKFNNSADEFWSQYGSESWVDKLGIKLAEDVEATQTPVPVEKVVEKFVENSKESEVE